MKVFNEAVSLKTDSAETFNNLGATLKLQGKTHDAIKAYEKALSIQADYPDASSNLGLLLYEAREYDSAVKFFSKDLSLKSQTFLMKCLYKQNKKTKFFDQLDYLINQGEINAVIGSYVSRSQIRYNAEKKNPFCNSPLKYVSKVDLTQKCDFNEVFVKGANAILSGGTVENRSQGLLTNGIQTAGNVFDQIGPLTTEIQKIIRDELEIYRTNFKDSQEGLIKNWPLNFSINGWLVSMKSGGELAPHIHEAGWLSGSIYINVPRNLTKNSGNLVVSMYDELNKNDKDKENSKSINVTTGSLCLFPASLLHYTIPFQSNEDRIVLAFDVVPE